MFMREIHEKEAEKMPENNIKTSAEKGTELKSIREKSYFLADLPKGEKPPQDAEKIKCRHEDLSGKNHPVTGVPYGERTIKLEGKTKVGTFPEFESQYDVKLPKEYHKKTDKEQFEQCNYTVSDAAEKDRDLKKRFKEELFDCEEGVTPYGYTWHHTENPGEFHLVDSYTHNKTGHSGGRSVWGGGSENR